MARTSINSEWIIPQKKAFTAWVNTFLKARGSEIHEEFVDTAFSDGVKLIEFLEEYAGKRARVKIHKNAKNRIHKVENLTLALSFFESLGLFRSDASVEDFLDSNEKAILGFVWSMFKKLGSQGGSTDEGEQSPLLKWIVERTSGYKGVEVINFSSSFQDGLAFCALLHNQNPEILDFYALDPSDVLGNLTLAFNVAEKHFRVPQLLDAQDFLTYPPEKKSVEMYLTLLYNAFHVDEEKLAQERKLREESAAKGSLQEQLADLKLTVATLEGSLAEARSKIAALKFEKELAAESLSKRDTQVAELKGELDAGATAYEEKERALAKAEMQRAEDEKALAEARAAKADVDAALAALQAEKHSLLEDLVGAKTALQEEIELREEEDAAHKETLDMLQAVSDEKADIAALLAECQEELKQVKAANAEAEEARQAGARRSELELQEQVLALMAAKGTAQADAGALRVTVTNLEARLQEATEAGASSAADLRAATADRDYWRSKYESHMVECKKATRHAADVIRAMQKESASLNEFVDAQKAELVRRSNVLSEERAKLEQEKSQLQLSNADFDVLLQKLRDMYDTFDDEVALAKAVFGKKTCRPSALDGNQEGTLTVKMEGTMKGWNQRYVVAKDNFVLVFKDESSKDVLTAVRMDTATVETVAEKNRPHAVRVARPGHKDVTIAFPDQPTYFAWLDGFEAARKFWDRRDALVAATKASQPRGHLAMMLAMTAQMALPSGIVLSPNGMVTYNEKNDAAPGRSLQALEANYKANRKAVLEASSAAAAKSAAPDEQIEREGELRTVDATTAAVVGRERVAAVEALTRLLDSPDLSKAERSIERARLSRSTDGVAKVSSAVSVDAFSATSPAPVMRLKNGSSRRLSVNADRVEELRQREASRRQRLNASVDLGSRSALNASNNDLFSGERSGLYASNGVIRVASGIVPLEADETCLSQADVSIGEFDPPPCNSTELIGCACLTCPVHKHLITDTPVLTVDAPATP